jgi:hypothetical protein
VLIWRLRGNRQRDWNAHTGTLLHSFKIVQHSGLTGTIGSLGSVDARGVDVPLSSGLIAIRSDEVFPCLYVPIIRKLLTTLSSISMDLVPAIYKPRSDQAKITFPTLVSARTLSRVLLLRVLFLWEGSRQLPQIVNCQLISLCEAQCRAAGLLIRLQRLSIWHLAPPLVQDSLYSASQWWCGSGLDGSGVKCSSALRTTNQNIQGPLKIS